ncbi:MAG: formate dehydrogenase subunit alpha [Flavobacteriales bacterium]|nr:formate dehydrogenase subunit alpha [Flavobacteriales bacterium]
MNTAFINNKPYTFNTGESILAFVRRIEGEKSIPTLCDAPNLEAFGSCRVCSVEVAFEKDGKTKTVASCHTPVTTNLHIYHNTNSILELRKNIIELVLTDYPTDLINNKTKEKNELQQVVEAVGIKKIRYPKGANHFRIESDESHPYMRSDFSKCINCFRCIRACDEVQGEMVLSMAGRGFEAHVVKGFNQSFMDSDCVSCGACAQACPTGAISDVFESKNLENAKITRTICTYCGVGCNLEVATLNGKIKSIQAPYNAEVNQGHTCLKGRYAFKFYDHPDRLKTPLIKKDGIFKEVSWNEAYDFISSRLEKIKSENGADAIAGISSARTPNEENYLMQKFMRAVIGTNNIDCCARVCHSPTALGMQKTFGTGAATNSISELEFTDCIFVVGANPTNAHPVTGAKIKQKLMKGTVGIVVDPRKTQLAKYATYHLQLKPGTNVALLNMMLYFIITENMEDKEFIAKYCEGFEEMKNEILRLDISQLEKITGVDKNLVKQAAIAYAKANAAMEFHGLGVTEHYQGTYTVQLLADLAMITGNVGKKGAGVNPLRGQNNVQGAADMGAQPHQGAGYLDVTDASINKKYNQFYGVEVPSNIGYKIPEMFDAAIDGKLKALWVIGEDVVQTDPNTQKVMKALKNLDLLVVSELFMTETAKLATVILPASSFLEKEGTFTNGERRIQRVQKVVEPLENTKPDGQIIVEMMRKMGYNQCDYTAENMLKEISQIVPFFAGVKWDELGINGKQWPVKADGSDTEILHKDGFVRGKGKFYYCEYEESNEVKTNSKDYPYIITTNRELEHYNCGAMTRRTGNVEIVTEDFLLINPTDAEKNYIHDGDLVCVESPRGKVDIKAKITDEVKQGILSSTFHFPEIMLNNITSNEHDSEAMCPEYKVVSCRIRKSRGKNLVV